MILFKKTIPSITAETTLNSFVYQKGSGAGRLSIISAVTNIVTNIAGFLKKSIAGCSDTEYNTLN